MQINNFKFIFPHMRSALLFSLLPPTHYYSLVLRTYYTHNARYCKCAHMHVHACCLREQNCVNPFVILLPLLLLLLQCGITFKCYQLCSHAKICVTTTESRRNTFGLFHCMATTQITVNFSLTLALKKKNKKKRAVFFFSSKLIF